MTVFQKLGALAAVVILCVGFSGCCGKKCALFGGGSCASGNCGTVSAPVAATCDTCSPATTSYAQPSYSQPTYSQPTYSQPTYSQPTYSAPTTSYSTQDFSQPVSVGSGSVNVPQVSVCLLYTSPSPRD